MGIFDEIHVTGVENNERAFTLNDFTKLAKEMNLRVIEEDKPVEFVRKFKLEGDKAFLWFWVACISWTNKITFIRKDLTFF